MSNNEITGLVQNVETRRVNSKYSSDDDGKTAVYTYTISGLKYGGGFQGQLCNIGDTIKFTYSENGVFKNMDKGSLQIVAVGDSSTRAVPGAVSASPAAPSGPPVMGFPVHPTDVRQSVVRSAAMNMIISTVSLTKKDLETPQETFDKMEPLAELISAYITGEKYFKAMAEELDKDKVEELPVEAKE